MVFGVSQRDAQVPCKRRSFGATEELHTKGLEIRTTNSITTKYLKFAQGPLHCVELIEIIKMEFWFTQFGVRKTKLWPLQESSNANLVKSGRARPPGLQPGRPASSPGHPASSKGRPASY